MTTKEKLTLRDLYDADKMTYHWEIQPTAEVDPHFVFTTTDSVADAAKQFEDAWGDISIMYIRKIAVTERFDYEDFEEVS